VAETLAEMKAQRVGAKVRGRFVLGSDQILECDGTWLYKPGTRDQARAQLKNLRGRSHSLITSAVLVRDQERIWHVVDRAELRMRDFSDAFLDWYLDAAGEDVLHSVGAYQLEGMGAQLFERVTGDFFTILGLPLLPVLGILREHGLVTR
jgi:nucleoside triphosphate pyrophosphatase